MKIRQIDFYYFSGTGNTKLVVRRMKDVFESNGIKVIMRRIEKSNPEEVNPQDVMGLGFPVATQGTFKFIWDFVERLPRVDGTPVFMVDTLGIYSGGIVGPMGKILKKKGFHLLGAREIKMPGNLLPMEIDEEKNREIVEKGLEEAERYAKDLIEGKTSWKDIPIYSDALSLISRSENPWRLYRKLIPFRIDTEKCIYCGICVKLCPVNNILMEKDVKIEYRDNCQFCMRCISFCPTKAIFMPRWKNKRYRAVKVSDLLKDD